MTFERQFVVASRSLAFLGIAALASAGAVGTLYLALSLLTVVWTGILGWQGRGHGLGPQIANMTSAAAMVLIFAPVVFRGAPPIAAIAEFLLVLTALRALAAEGARDWIQIYALSFFELVAASALTVEPLFAVIFLLYLLLAPWALVLLCLRGEVDRHGAKARLADARFVDASLFRGVAGVTVVLFLSTLAVFVFFPRMGAGLFASPFATGGGLTGFSDEVGLGDVTALKANEAVAMRVTVDRPERLEGPQYWRGAALDTFDGRRWSRGRYELRLLSRSRPGVFVAEGRRPLDVLWQEIILEPMENPTIFFVGEPLQLQGRFSTAMVDGLGNLRAITPSGARVRYEILSSLAPRSDPPTARSREVPDLDPRVPALAREITAGIHEPARQSAALLEWFRRGFRYTTEPGDPGDADPLARFLFDTRAGHCEYFASSLAILLRTLGIPSLVVNGYHGGEWNSYGEYLVVRQSDAHSWVEAWIDGRWRTLDPTPPSAVPPPSRTAMQELQAMIDAWQMRWYRYVINYSLQDQVEITLSLRDSSRLLWRGLSGEGWREAWERLRRGSRSGSGAWSLAPFVGIAAVAGAALLWSRRRRRRAEAALGWATIRYAAMLRVLEGRGLRRRPADTPEEFLRRIERDLDGDREIVAQVTALYQEARFSGRERPSARSELDRLLERLESRP